MDRWVEAGGTWLLLAETTDSVSIGLLRCDGGEIAERIDGSAAQFRDWLTKHDGAPGEGDAT